MTRLRVSSVTLDLDGTLLDTVTDLHAAAAATLAELGLPQRSEAEVRNFVGRGIPNLVQRCLPEGWVAPEGETALDVFKRHYARVNGTTAKPYPGVIEGLEAFRRMGLPLAVITNKASAFTGPLLAATDLARYFEFAISGDSLAEKKPHPLPLLNACARLGSVAADNLHIGDSASDADSARAAGCPVFCVPYGYNEGRAVHELDCDAIVATLEAAATMILPRQQKERST